MNHPIIFRAIYDGQRTQLIESFSDERQITLSTSTVTPMWAQWWTFEPLRSRRAWLWVPCILKAETTTLLDRKTGATEITFTAVLDRQGGLL